MYDVHEFKAYNKFFEITGIKATSKVQFLQDMNTVCYDKVLEQVRQGYQVMVFVHARNDTVRTAMVLRDLAKNNGEMGFFAPEQSAQYGQAEKSVSRSLLQGDSYLLSFVGFLSTCISRLHRILHFIKNLDWCFMEFI